MQLLPNHLVGQHHPDSPFLAIHRRGQVAHLRRRTVDIQMHRVEAVGSQVVGVLLEGHLQHPFGRNRRHPQRDGRHRPRTDYQLAPVHRQAVVRRAEGQLVGLDKHVLRRHVQLVAHGGEADVDRPAHAPGQAHLLGEHGAVALLRLAARVAHHSRARPHAPHPFPTVTHQVTKPSAEASEGTFCYLCHII